MTMPTTTATYTPDQIAAAATSAAEKIIRALAARWKCSPENVGGEIRYAIESMAACLSPASSAESAAFTWDQAREMINDAADETAEEYTASRGEVPEIAANALDLMINATAHLLQRPEMTLGRIIMRSYTSEVGTVLGWLES